ncbi:hypothetical protein GR130_08380 [Streptomyces sp. GS7]|nr:hypothetical protein GR130_08380 [Streptomyces sp. GS7]
MTTSSTVRRHGDASATDWNDRLATARPEEFTDLFHEAVTEDFGTVARLHQILETASQWCHTHDARSSASALDTLTTRLTDLGDELHLVGENVNHEIRTRSHRAAAAAARPSPVASAWGSAPGEQIGTPTPAPPSTARPLPRSR